MSISRDGFRFRLGCCLAGAVIGSIFGVAVALAPLSSRAAEYDVVDVANGGVVRGRIELFSPRSWIQEYIISKDTAICGKGLYGVQTIRVKGKALLDAVVYIEGVRRGKPFPASSKKTTINQRNCRFKPYLSVLMNGGELEAVNSDRTLHNIHVYELTRHGRSSVLNVSQPRKGNIVAKRISAAKGHALKVECDAHDFMQAYVFMARNPYYDLVDGNGGFEIPNVPPGRYVIRAWHPTLGEQSASVVVSPGRAATVDFLYRE